MGQEFNREQLAGSHTSRSLRKGKSAKVPLRTAPRGLPATVAADNSDWTPLSDSQVDWRSLGDTNPPAFDATPPNGAAYPSPADGTSPTSLSDDRRDPVLSVVPELRGLLDNLPSYEPLVEDYQPVTSPTASLVTRSQPAVAEPQPNADLERDLLARLGKAASASVRGHSPKPLEGPIENVGDRTFPAGRRDPDITAGIDIPLPHTLDTAIPRRPAAQPAAEGVAPATAGTDTKKLKQLEAESAALKSGMHVIQGTLADLERSVQHQLSALEERIVAALQRIDVRQAESSSDAYVDSDAIEARVIARLQPFDAATVEQRLAARIESLEPEALEQRVAARLAALDPAAVEERIVTRLQAGGVRALDSDGDLSPEMLAALEDRIHSKLTQTQTAVLDQRLADQLRNLDPSLIEQRVIANVPNRAELAAIEARLAELAMSTPAVDLDAVESRLQAKIDAFTTAQPDVDLVGIEQRFETRLAAVASDRPDVDVEAIEQRLEARLAALAESRATLDLGAMEQRFEDRLAALVAERPSVDVDGLEQRLTAKLEAFAEERPAVDVVALEGRLEQRLQSALAEAAEAQPVVDVEALESRFELKLNAFAAERPVVDIDAATATLESKFDAKLHDLADRQPVVDVDALTANLDTKFDAKLQAFADSQPVLDVDGLEAHVNEKLQSFVDAQPVVDLVAFEARMDAKLAALAAETPTVDVEDLEARLIAKFEAALAAQPVVDLDGARAEIVSDMDAKIEAIVAAQPVIDVEALEARLTEMIPTVDVETIALRARELISAHDLVAINAAIAELGGQVRQKIVETHEALNKVEVRVAGRLQESVDAESRVVTQLAHLDQRNSSRERLIDDRLTAMENRIADQSDDLKLEISGLSAALFQQVDSATDKLAEAGEEKIAAVLVQVEQSSAAVLEKLEASSKQQSEAAQGRIDQLEGRVNEQLAKMSNNPQDIEPIRERIGRIGLELAAATDEHNTLKEALDKRLGGIETANEILTAKVIESSSVDIAVYLDRIAEIERAISELDPDRFALAEEVQALADRLTPMPPPAPRP